MCWATVSALGQGWQRTFPNIGDSPVKDIKQTADGGFILCGNKTTWFSPNHIFWSTSPYVLKLDANGDTLWSKTYDNISTPSASSIFPTQQGDYILTTSNNNVMINSAGVIYPSWIENHAAYIITETANNGFVMYTNSLDSINDFNISLYETNQFGDTLWINNYGDAVVRDLVKDVKQTQDGGYIIASLRISNTIPGNYGHVNLIKVDAVGNQEWSKLYGDTSSLQDPFEVQQTTDGGYIVTNQSRPHNNANYTGSQTYLIKTNAIGDTTWTKTYGTANFPEHGSSIKQTPDNGYVLSVERRDINQLQFSKVFFVKLDSTGTLVSSKELGKNDASFGAILQSTHDGGFILACAQEGGPYSHDNNIHLAKMDSLGTIHTGMLEGLVFQDNNNNCVYDSTIDHSMPGIIISISNSSGLVYHITTDSNGLYSTEVDTGTNIIQIGQNLPYHYQNCQSQIDTLNFDSSYQSKVSDVPLTPLFQCPLLYVDISAPFLRQTNIGSYYTVSYCNNGTSAAQNPYVEVDLDPNLTILSSSIPIHNQVNNTYRFNLSNINLGDCGSFQIQVISDTSSIAGQIICTEVHIYPDSICIPNLWNGPNLSASAQCLNDTIYFQVRNKGAAMSVGNTYYVYEDNIMLRTGSTNPLGTNATQQIIQPAAQGRTYRFEVEQNVNFPALLGDSITSASVSGCNVLPGGLFNTGFLTQFSNGSSAPFEAIDCQPLLTSYDPNDKSAQPVGYGNNHYIYDYIALDYKIRFQNTGTDTAFRVVIRDTLSSYLDPASIQMGASSHNYTWRVYGSNILEVTFDNILLPDSTTNELASNGFFRFRIAQQTANPLGSIIYNRAAIYFDYNAPIITNETFHTISDHFVVIQLLGTEDILTKEISNIKVYPNPFEKQSTIEIVGKTYHHLELRIYDLTGKLVQQQSSTGNQFTIQRQQLEAGMYLYQLEGDQELLNTGKLIVR